MPADPLPPTAPRGAPIALDCDVLCGAWPARAELDFGLPAVRRRLDRAGIATGLVCSGRGAWFDDVDGNTETLAAAAGTGRPTEKTGPATEGSGPATEKTGPVAEGSGPATEEAGPATEGASRPAPGAGWLAAGTINLRNALRAGAELDRLVENGVRAVRLFGPLQGCEPGFPGYRHVVDEALRRGLVVLVEGDVRACWPVFADRGARVVFLDVHAYHVADFVLLARREPGFVASTRLLNAPDSIETVAGEVGAAHLAFGSRTPLHDTSPSVLRVRRARLSGTDWAAVTGGTLRTLLEKP